MRNEIRWGGWLREVGGFVVIGGRRVLRWVIRVGVDVV